MYGRSILAQLLVALLPELQGKKARMRPFCIPVCGRGVVAGATALSSESAKQMVARCSIICGRSIMAQLQVALLTKLQGKKARVSHISNSV